jgi:hypothetical protein
MECVAAAELVWRMWSEACRARRARRRWAHGGSHGQRLANHVSTKDGGVKGS